MTVAAVLAQDRRGLPQHEMRLPGPGQAGVGGGERPASVGAASAARRAGAAASERSGLPSGPR